MRAAYKWVNGTAQLGIGANVLDAGQVRVRCDIQRIEIGKQRLHESLPPQSVHTLRRLSEAKACTHHLLLKPRARVRERDEPLDAPLPVTRGEELTALLHVERDR